MKGNTINVRLTDEERSKLETSAANLNMSLSQYVRTLVNDHPYCPIDKSKELIAQVCKIYSVITEQNLHNNEALMKEVNALCQIFY